MVYLYLLVRYVVRVFHGLRFEGAAVHVQPTLAMMWWLETERISNTILDILIFSTHMSS